MPTPRETYEKCYQEIKAAAQARSKAATKSAIANKSIQATRGEGTTSKANNESQRRVTFVDLERGPPREVVEECKGAYANPTTRCADVCSTLLFSICVAAAVIGFMKLPIAWGVGLVLYLVGFYIWMISCVIALRDYYLEKQAGDNAQVPN
ncbi:hypothetical protein ACP4OV_024991 [Aristida adscensionis]